MAYQTPQYTRGQVRRAGNALREARLQPETFMQAMPIITNWRAAHAYPLNTFQSTLRMKLSALGMPVPKSVVGQRLKRLPSIVSKLQRFDTMSLDRMQDIAGLRAVVSSMRRLRMLREAYENKSRFSHELRSIHDYVMTPKDDGYRSIHLVYRYENSKVPGYNGLHVELQFRTQVQHAWATAVETVDTFFNQAIKAGRADRRWGEFFQLASAAFASIEQTPVHDQLRSETESSIRERLFRAEADLNVLMRLKGIIVAADKIHGMGKSPTGYHLIVLDTSRRVLNIKSFSNDQLEAATEAYSLEEYRAAQGQSIDPVLVAGGSVEQLRQTYPNYFLDATIFLNYLRYICNFERRGRGLAIRDAEYRRGFARPRSR
ncbi:RelA/SpoT domain-containing protein [Xanthomonas citri pv. glycines]|nr:MULTISPECIES: RelA/SpoT domain-containing protein [Xanthomonas]AOY64022.2 (p)ppGpp synthetase [Xanthomonas citri pv. glycines str. 8ra]QDR44315.1 (p)ppGpp synthetase [Xanthomonas citri pv. glycines]QDS06506.1 (p)ppGpp synthetase [Xanthomonas citri pv. glycines]QDS10785.1 (p)ppGpp synthetase [Xanthomonas citri pv. glycines]QDS19456.1 (p)ppGpp synthetase [Xanthomonas citri pv. glycines]